MKSLFNFIVEPVSGRYNNSKKIDDKELIVNTEISNHQFISKEARVIAVPTAFDTDIKVGDTVLVHHNVFRRFFDVRANEKNSRSFIDENTYIAQPDQVFLYKSSGDWKCVDGYCFVQPIKNKDSFELHPERPLIGIAKYTDGTVDKGDLVGFKPNSRFEFIVDGKRLYRVLSKFITIKYEYQGDEEEYNPSWAQSG